MTAVPSRLPKSRAPQAGVGTTPERARSRWHWREWPVVVKLAAVLLVPTIVALVTGVLRIVDQASAAPGYARISQIVRVQQQLSDLIGSLARERDLATVFVATGRVGDRRALDAQFGAVDGSVRVVAGATGRVERLEFVRAPLAALGALAPLRASVTSGFSPVEVVVTEYSGVIDPLMDLDAALTRQLDDVAVTNIAAAAHNLLAGREQVSRQHAIVSAALYSNRLGPGQIEDLRTAAVRLAAEQDAVRATLAPAEQASALAGLGPDAELARQRMFQLVLNRGIAGQPLNTSPEDWDRRTALVVDNIAAVEKGLQQRVEQAAQRLLDQVRTTAGLNSVILFFALALGVLIAILVTRALLRPLGVLRRTALDIADRRLPEAMARIRDGEDPGSAIEPVPVGTREEIGQVARAFDEVHSQAIRLASEQAQLRANVNDIFVNLSRRTQGLVERQLKLIDRLESGEQDPQQLDNLFQLDHLATRMRRNSENLLVLAGTDATNRSGRPVRLIDVLRAAVSEVEQYQRLVLQQPPAVLVLGRTAGDLVHLLAELLDNATQFSPPDSHVMVSSERIPDGAVTIEVTDRGVGMTDTELAEANQRLASPAAVDASVSRRMGLFVVGRLAGRHGIDVQLRRGEGGVGVWACVTMPARLVRAAVEPLTADGAELAATPVVTANGSLATSLSSVQGTIAEALAAERNGVPVPRPHAEPSPDTGVPNVETADVETAEAETAEGQEADASDQRSEGDEISGELPDADGQDTDTAQADDSGQRAAETDPPSGDCTLPRRNGNRPAPADPPPAPPGPPPSPSTDGSPRVPGAASGTDLFRAARTSVAGPPARPPHRATLQHSTPIFDDVASAWFKKHEAVPVRWNAPPARGPAAPTRQASAPVTPSPDAPVPDAPATDVPPPTVPAATVPAAPAADVPAANVPAATVPAATVPATKVTGVQVTAPATVGSPPLTRRQPGKTLIQSESSGAGKARPSGQPVPASVSTPPAGAPASEWGAGDEGWRAAQALVQPMSTELTTVGLPRRQPRALLVPGAPSDAGSTVASPARSAEMIRGRLASYQQGVREGRQARENLASSNGGGPRPEQQDAKEETT